MKRLKIALVHNIIAPYRQPIFEALAEEDSIDLSVYYCSKSHKTRKWEVSSSNSYKNEVLRGITLSPTKDFFYHINPSIFYKIFKEKFDIVIIGGSTNFTMQVAYLASKLTKTPVILWSEEFEGTKSFLGKLISPITTSIIKNVNAIILPGKNAFDYHSKICGDQNKLFIAPNIVDNKFFMEKGKIYKKEKNKLKKDLGFEGKKVLIFVGRLIERKGIKYLLDSFKQLKKDLNDVSLVIIGEGPLEETLKETCKLEGINDVNFTGWLSEDRLIYFSIADVFCLPSLKDLCPLVLNEAMCCNLPIVTTEMVGCARDMVIPGRNGFIVEIKNSEELYSKIKEVLCNDPEKMGLESEKIIKENFMIENTIKGFLDAIAYSKGE